MLETAFANLRFAASMLFGVPFHQRSLDRIVESMRATMEELGALGDEADALLGGPALDEKTRHDIQGRRFRAQALRAARETAYYAQVLTEAGIDPAKLTYKDIARVPVTAKDTLRDNPEAFVRRTAKVATRVTSTGTTGWPTSVYFSEYELHVIGAFAAFAYLTERRLDPDDIVQIAITTRATLGMLGVTRGCAAVGTAVHPAGMVSPDHTLRLLTEKHHLPGKKPKVSALSSYPTYFGQLVERGLELGYGPSDFGLQKVLTGGELLTDGLRRRSEQLFGELSFLQHYALTELDPMTGNLCLDGHLHFEPSAGIAEVLDPESHQPVAPGEPGVLVGTVLPPYRETTILLRYNTEDMVRALSGPFTCNLRNMPATSHLLGKLRLSARHDHGWTFMRDVQEALEAVQAVPLPARYGFCAVPGGVAVEVRVRSATAQTRRALEAQLAERGVPVQELRLVEDPAELHRPIPLRCDLQEATFDRPADHLPRVAMAPATAGTEEAGTGLATARGT
jgi:phenylacetate-CoA ligase